MRRLWGLISFMMIGVVVWPAMAVPYYASIRKDRVNLRTGPGERFPIEWVYQERGYPVEVIDQFDIWRQVREADGTIGWMHRTMLGRQRTALVREEGVLTVDPDGKKVVAVVQQGTIGNIERCPKGGSYCLLSFQRDGQSIEGWFPRRMIWGLYPDEEID